MIKSSLIGMLVLTAVSFAAHATPLDSERIKYETSAQTKAISVLSDGEDTCNQKLKELTNKLTSYKFVMKADQYCRKVTISDNVFPFMGTVVFIP